MILPLKFYDDLRHQLRPSEVIGRKVALTRKGNEYLGICPFHTEKTPSFTVNDAKRFYHCFGCGAHGDVIKFVAECNGMAYREAAIKLAQDNSIELPKMTSSQKREYDEMEEIYNVLEIATGYFTRQVTKEIEEYLAQRGIEETARKRFSIGYAPGKGHLLKYFEEKAIPLKILLASGLAGKKEDGKIYEVFNNRIMFPIYNIYNRVAGFGGRIIGEGLPKYINSPETLVFKKSETMYGENTAISAAYKKNYSIIVEGYMDVIALNQAGISEAVASLGTSVTEKHIQKLWRAGDEIIVCLDGDAAGQRATARLIGMCLPMITNGKKLSFIKLPDAQDPDEVIRSGGGDSFNALLAKRMELSATIWQNEYVGKIFPSPESINALRQKLAEHTGKIKDKSLANDFRLYFNEQIWQNLRRRSKTQVQNKGANGARLTDTVKKTYTEMEVVENSICSFIIKFPYILKNLTIREAISALELHSSLDSVKLNDFKEWLVGQADEFGSMSEEEIGECAKKTGFAAWFSLLSDPDQIFLDLGFINKNQEDYEQIFNLLSKQHYLLNLRLEGEAIMRDKTKAAYDRGSCYAQEIKEASQELNKLSSVFIN